MVSEISVCWAGGNISFENRLSKNVAGSVRQDLLIRFIDKNTLNKLYYSLDKNSLICDLLFGFLMKEKNNWFVINRTVSRDCGFFFFFRMETIFLSFKVTSRNYLSSLTQPDHGYLKHDRVAMFILIWKIVLVLVKKIMNGTLEKKKLHFIYALM